MRPLTVYDVLLFAALVFFVIAIIAVFASWTAPIAVASPRIAFALVVLALLVKSR
jgi:hypothetical protein